MSISPMAETKSISAGVPDIGPGGHSPIHGGHGPGGPSPFGAHYGAPHHGSGDPYSHHYYPQQNSPYFPMYQPHYHHHYHQPSSEPIPLSDYSPGSEAGSSPNDYFYGSGSQANSAVNSNSNSNYHHHSLATSPSSFPFESNESSSKALIASSSASSTSANNNNSAKKSKLNNNTSSSSSLHQPIIPGSNKKERRRTQSINNAFSSLRDCIPNVPCDTKLSKIKTLRLATSYIDYLMQMLNSENVTSNAITGFKADIHKRWKEKSEEQKRRELEEELNNNEGTYRRMTKPCKGGARTGWPQHVWALELKN